jgi:dCTP diphosphatase
MAQRNCSVNIGSIMDEIRYFIRERDWDKYHTPRNLAASISVEANELLETFQWENPSFAEIRKDRAKVASVSSEIADVQIYLLELIDNLGLDMEPLLRAKIQLNRDKYPIEKCRGKADKYHSYREDIATRTRNIGNKHEKP